MQQAACNMLANARSCNLQRQQQPPKVMAQFSHHFSARSRADN